MKLFLFIMAVALAVGAVMCQAPRIVLINRDLRNDLIRFECRDSQGFRLVSNSGFFANISNVIVPLESTRPGELIFNITQDREGFYFCRDLANNNESNRFGIVARPVANPATPTMYETRIGRNITIDCPFRPGALSQFYSVQWLRIRTGPPRSFLTINSRTFIADGFEVLSNFSLVINASRVEFVTTRDRFECTVIVTNPPTNQNVFFESNSNNLIQVKTFNQVLFQIKVHPVQPCIFWTESRTTAVEAGIMKGVTEAIRQRCDCDFNATDIVDGAFSCPNVTTEVTYRATLRGRIDTDRAGRLRTQIRRFVQRGPRITYSAFLLRVDPTCPVSLSSLTDPECPDITPVLAGYGGK